MEAVQMPVDVAEEIHDALTSTSFDLSMARVKLEAQAEAIAQLREAKAELVEALVTAIGRLEDIANTSRGAYASLSTLQHCRDVFIKHGGA